MPSTQQSITISTPIENVWKKLSAFHEALTKFDPTIYRLEYSIEDGP